MEEREIIKTLTDVRDSFTEVIVELKKKPNLVNTRILDLIDCINSLSVEI